MKHTPTKAYGFWDGKRFVNVAIRRWSEEETPVMVVAAGDWRSIQRRLKTLEAQNRNLRDDHRRNTADLVKQADELVLLRARLREAERDAKKWRAHMTLNLGRNEVRDNPDYIWRFDGQKIKLVGDKSKGGGIWCSSLADGVKFLLKYGYISEKQRAKKARA